MSDEKDENAGTVKKPSAFRQFVRKHPVLTTIVAGLVVVTAVYYGKEIQGNLQKKALVKAANLQMAENTEALAKSMAKPAVWSIRAEMLRGNMEQVALLMTDLVKQSRIESIHLLQPDGTVWLSTNKRMEGLPMENDTIRNVLSADTTSLFRSADRHITVVSPIMGYDKRLGTLVMEVGYDLFDPNTANTK